MVPRPFARTLLFFFRAFDGLAVPGNFSDFGSFVTLRTLQDFIVQEPRQNNTVVDFSFSVAFRKNAILPGQMLQLNMGYLIQEPFFDRINCAAHAFPFLLGGPKGDCE